MYTRHVVNANGRVPHPGHGTFRAAICKAAVIVALAADEPAVDGAVCFSCVDIVAATMMASVVGSFRCEELVLFLALLPKLVRILRKL